MRIIVCAAIGAAAAGTAASANIIPVVDERTVQVQGAVTPGEGNPLFNTDTNSPSQFEPFSDSAQVLLEAPGVTFSGLAVQDSVVSEGMLVASGAAVVTLSADGEGLVASGSTKSRYAITFGVNQTTSFQLAGTVRGYDAANDAGEAWTILRLIDEPSGLVLVEEEGDDGSDPVAASGVLPPGTYQFIVESHATGTITDSVGGTATGSYAIELTFTSLCTEDLDADGTVGVNDLLALLAVWGEPSDGPADLNGDGVVGIADLVQLLSAWGACADE